MGNIDSLDIPTQLSALLHERPGKPVESGDIAVEDTFVFYPEISGEKQIAIYTYTGIHDMVLVQYMSQKLEEMRQNLSRSDVEITGMLNIHQRLKLMYPELGGLFLDRSEFGGLKVSVRISTEKGKALPAD